MLFEQLNCVAILLLPQNIHLLLPNQRNSEIVRLLSLLVVESVNLIVFQGPVLRAHLNGEVLVLYAPVLSELFIFLSCIELQKLASPGFTLIVFALLYVSENSGLLLWICCKTLLFRVRLPWAMPGVDS